MIGMDLTTVMEVFGFFWFENLPLPLLEEKVKTS